MVKKFLLGALAIAGAAYVVHNFKTDTTQSEAERALATAKAEVELRQAEAKVRAENTANLAAKEEEARATQQKTWDNAFNEDYQAERDARWRELTSPPQ